MRRAKKYTNSVLERGARATRAWIEGGYVCLCLEDEREIRFPAAKNRRLRAGNAEQLAKMELICNGTGVHWPELDEDLSVQGIIDGWLGAE